MQDLVISPEPFIQKCRSFARAKNLCLEVVDGSIRLAGIDGSNGDQEFMQWGDTIGLAITYDMLEEALSEAEAPVMEMGAIPKMI